MPVKKRKIKKVITKRSKKPAKPVIGIFDDALPVSLKNKGTLEFISPNVRLHTHSNAKLSPYIVKLERQNNTQFEGLKYSQPDRIKQLALEIASSCEDDSLEETPDESLVLDFDELTSQLREPQKIVKLCTANDDYKPKHEECAVASIAVQTPDVFEVISEQIIIADNPQTSDRYEEIQIPKVTSKFSRLHILLPKQARHRAMATFLLLSFILVMPIHAMQSLSGIDSQKDQIQTTGEQAILQIQSATEAIKDQNYEAAGLDFERASQNFDEAQKSMDSMRFVAASLVNIIPQTNSTYKTVQGLVSAGSSLSYAASRMSKGIEELSDSQSLSIATKLNLFTTYISDALPQIQIANKALEDVDIKYIPAEYSDDVALMLQTIPMLEKSMEEFLEFSQTMGTILGSDQKMRYLLVFQNNTELRATGGFIGSFAQIDVFDGEIVDMNIPAGGSYDVQGQLSAFVTPPQPLTLINDRWEFHDANWMPDFPSSAQKLIEFYEKSGGPTVDGVIAINATLMPKLLEITGPIEMQKYGRIINSENFLFETQKIVEFEYTQFDQDAQRQEEAPKQFIGDLAPEILNVLKNTDTEALLSVVDLVSSSLCEKDVILYMRDNSVQAKIQSLDWSGELKSTQSDYLMVVDSNLGGGKTDTVIKQNIAVDVEVQNDGSIINTVKITKQHTGLASAMFEGINNVDYIRLYVPQGSVLLQASGFEIPNEELFKTPDASLTPDPDLLLWTSNFAQDEISKTDIWDEQGKTVFGNWMQTKPGETETVSFSYRLPWKFEQKNQSIMQKAKSYLGLKNLDQYSILIQKQPGVENRQTTVRVYNATNQKVLWQSQDDLLSSGVSFTNQTDKMLSAIFEQF